MARVVVLCCLGGWAWSRVKLRSPFSCQCARRKELLIFQTAGALCCGMSIATTKVVNNKALALSKRPPLTHCSGRGAQSLKARRTAANNDELGGGATAAVSISHEPIITTHPLYSIRNLVFAPQTLTTISLPSLIASTALNVIYH